MFDQVSRRNQQDAMMLRQAKKLSPVEHRKIPVLNAMARLGSQCRAGERTQEIKFFVVALGWSARARRLGEKFGHEIELLRREERAQAGINNNANRHYNTESSARGRIFAPFCRSRS